MARIDFYALGGLGEDGKNMYVLEIDNDLFILDAGLKYPTDELHGVDAILPDYEHLKNKGKRIQGLFLSHGHEDHIGAVPKFLKEFDVPVYGTYFTLALLQDAMEEEDVEKRTFHEINKDTVLTFGSVKVSFYRTTHSIPGSVGMAFETPDGIVVYSPDYTFDQNVDRAYATSFERLAHIARKKVLALMTESLGAEQSGYSHTGRELDQELNRAFLAAAGERVVVSTFSTDIFRIQKVVDIALKHDRKIAIIGRKAQRMVDIAVNLGVLKIPKEKLLQLRFIDEKNKNELPDAVVLVTGDRHEPFYMLQRMVRKLDRLIHLDEDDHVIMMTPPVPGTEKIAARTLDILYRNDIRILRIPKEILPAAHAKSEDIKLLTNILRPKYFVPVVGEHRHFYAMKRIAKNLGFAADEIRTLENGEVLRFVNGDCKGVTHTVKSGDVLVDGILEGDVGDVVLKDREILSQDGLLVVIGHIDARQKRMVKPAEVVSRGFVYMKENEPLIQKVKEIYEDVARQALNKKRVDFRSFKEKLREDVSRHLYKATDRRPIVIPVIIDVDKE